MTMKFSLSMFRRGFNSSKCKTMAKMAVARIKLLRNKRQMVVRQMRRDIALLLQSGQDATARIRVEHVIREQNIMAANEIIELFCELIVARLSIISKRRECPADLKEGISSLIFSAPRCSEIPELAIIRDIFEKKYGNEFVSAATDLRPSCGVNSLLIDKLSVRAPAGEVKLKVMKEIAKEYQIEWDTKETELELLKPPEKLIEGPATFVSASSIPINPKVTEPAGSYMSMTRPAVGEERDAMLLNSIEQAAEAGVKKALEAHSSVQLPNNGYTPDNKKHGLNNNSNSSSIDFGYCSTPSDQSAGILKYIGHQSEVSGRTNESRNFERSHSNGGDARSSNVSVNKVSRRHSYNVPPMHSDIKFDESDCDKEIKMEEPQGNNHPPPDRLPPVVPPSQATQDPVHRVHPKLPDYDALAARFEALKYRKS